jgi:hypothetical protein
VLLVRKGIGSIGHVLKFYLLTGLLVGAYILLSYKLPPVLLFTGYWLLVALAFVKFPPAKYRETSLQVPAN